MAELKYNIEQNIACITEEKHGWSKELNLVSWNGQEAKYDIECRANAVIRADFLKSQAKR